jgi:hypothetical protein
MYSLACSDQSILIWQPYPAACLNIKVSLVYVLQQGVTGLIFEMGKAGEQRQRGREEDWMEDGAFEYPNMPSEVTTLV